MPTGVYISLNRRGGVKGKSGVYSKSKEHKRKISETLKRKYKEGLLKSNLEGKSYKPWLGKHHSEETKEKISQNSARYWLGRKDKGGMKKEKHWHWKEDRTQLATNEKKHLDSRYREWSFTVKNRDNWECQIENSDCLGRMEAHHILRWKNFPELRYEVNNGITLCHFHHPRKINDEMRLTPFFIGLVQNQSN